MKHNIFLACATLLSIFFLQTSANAQTTGSKREVGLQFSSLNFNGGSFSAFYKKEKKENVYRRIRFVTGNIFLGLAEEETAFRFNAGFAIGREKRKALDDKLVFYHGPEFALSASVFTTEDEDTTPLFITPSFGWVFGLQHSFNDRWAINIETIPSFSVSARIYGGDALSGAEGLFFDTGGSNSVSLGLVRKF